MKNLILLLVFVSCTNVFKDFKRLGDHVAATPKNIGEQLFKGPQGEKGKDGVNGTHGQDGQDGKDVEFQLNTQLGLYLDHGQDNRSFNLTCMLGESNASGYTVLRIITGQGGIIEVQRHGKKYKDLVYLPANRAIYLYTGLKGTFKIKLDNTTKTKACNP